MTANEPLTATETSPSQPCPGHIVRRTWLTGKDNAVAICLAVLLFAVYLLTYRGGFHSIDEVSMFCVTESMVKHGTFDTNQIIWTQWTTSQREAQGFFGQNGSVYSKKGLALSLFEMPFYWLGLHIPGLGMLQVTSLVNSVMTAALGALLYLYIRRLDYATGVALFAGLIFGLTTSSWVYARYLFSEPLAGFLLFGAAYFLLAYRQERRWLCLVSAGLAAGLAVVARVNNAICLPFFAFYLLGGLINGDGRGIVRRLWSVRRVWWPFVLFILAAAAAGGITALYNWVRAGSIFQTGYDLTIFSPYIWEGLYKLLLSPLRGLFWFSPILLLSPLLWFYFYRRCPAEAALTSAVILVNVLLFAAWTSGEGLSWGSRFLVPVLPFAILPLACLLERVRAGSLAWLIVLVIIGTSSLGIQALAVVTNPWLHLADLHARFGAEFLEDTPALYDPQYSPIWGQVQQLLALDPARSDLAWWQPWGFMARPVAAALLLTAFALAALLLVTRACHRSQKGRLTVLPLLSVALAGAVSLSMMGWYYRQDGQFGPPGHPLHRILDYVTSTEENEDGIITLTPYHYHVPMNRYRGLSPVYGYSEMPPPLPEEAVIPLQQAITRHERIWLISQGISPGDPHNGVERWLAERAFKASDTWYDDFRLVLFAGLDRTEQEIAVNTHFGGGIVLRSYALGPLRGDTGNLVRLVLNWRAVGDVGEDYTVFIHLIAPDGRLVAQHDGAPVGGFSPTSTWPLGRQVTDRHALPLPDDLTRGQYTLWVGLYDPDTGERLPVRLADGTSDDHLTLARLEVD